MSTSETKLPISFRTSFKLDDLEEGVSKQLGEIANLDKVHEAYELLKDRKDAAELLYPTSKGGMIKHTIVKIHDNTTKQQYLLNTIYRVNLDNSGDFGLDEIQGDFEKLYNNDLFGAFIFQEGKIQLINRTFAEIFGLSDSGEVIGKDLKEFVCAEYRGLIDRKGNFDEPVVEVPGIYKIQGKRQGGEVIDLVLSLDYVIYNKKRAIQGLILNLKRRISDSQKFSKFRAIVDFASNGVAIFDTSGKIKYKNKAFQKSIDSRFNKKNNDIFQYLPDVTSSRVQSWIQNDESSVPFKERFVMSNKNREDIPMVLSAIKIPNDFENNFFFATQFFDLTILKKYGNALEEAKLEMGERANDRTSELKRAIGELGEEIQSRKIAEQKLEESEEKYRQLFENAKVGIFRSLADGSGFLDINSEFSDILGYAKKELMSLDLETIWFDRSDREKLYKELLHTGKVIDFESRILDKSGNEKFVSVSANYYQDKGFIEGVIIDISKRKKLEEKLRGKLKSERTILNFASRFIHLHPIKLEREITNSLQVLVENTESDGAFIYQLDRSTRELKRLYKWLSANEIPKPALPENIDLSKYQWFGLQFRKMNWDTLDIVSDNIPSDIASNELALLKRYNVKAVTITPLRINKKLYGILGLCAYKDMSKFDHETASLIHMYGVITSSVLARLNTERELNRTMNDLKASREELLQKNNVLTHIINTVELEKDKARSNIQTNIDRAILPQLRELKNSLIGVNTSRIEVMEEYLANISSSFINNLEALYRKLTPREIEICNLIRIGASSKKIADTLNISTATVNKHREQIRKKLNIHKKNINLTTYIQSL